jgi:hypothetical protein
MEGGSVRRAAAVFVAGIFLAGAFMSPAVAHIKTFSTSVTLTASDTSVKKGDTVVFTARVSSPKHACIVGRRVQLLEDGVVIATKTTNSNGVVKFRVKITSTATYQVRVLRKVLTTTHPHRHICAGATSNKVRVRAHGHQ